MFYSIALSLIHFTSRKKYSTQYKSGEEYTVPILTGLAYVCYIRGVLTDCLHRYAKISLFFAGVFVYQIILHGETIPVQFSGDF